jgi:hypothetical protein
MDQAANAQLWSMVVFIIFLLIFALYVLVESIRTPEHLSSDIKQGTTGTVCFANPASEEDGLDIELASMPSIAESSVINGRLGSEVTLPLASETQVDNQLSGKSLSDSPSDTQGNESPGDSPSEN